MLPRLHPPSLASPSRRAFTLIELLVVMGIVGFILTVSVVGFAPMFRRASIDKALQLLRAGMESARMRAIQQGRQVRFEARPVEASTSGTWEFSSSAGDSTAEWRQFPDFVSVQTNAPDPDVENDPIGVGGEYVAEKDLRWEPPHLRGRISLTFAPDGSLRRYVVELNDDEDDPTTDSKDADQGVIPPFAVRVSDNRDLGGEVPRRWVVVYPLTGSLRNYRTTEADD